MLSMDVERTMLTRDSEHRIGTSRNTRKLSEMEEQEVLQWSVGPAIGAHQVAAD